MTAHPALAVGDEVAQLRAGRELVGGLHRPVTVLGSWQTPPESPDWYRAELLGRLLVEADHDVVSGGGLGSMAAVSRGASEAGGCAVGLFVPLPGEPEPNPWVGQVVRFSSYALRKDALLGGATAVVALPGGLGTLDELLDVLVLSQVGAVAARPLVLVGRDHWDGLLRWLHDALVGSGMVAAADLSALQVVDDVRTAVELSGAPRRDGGA